jgi:hypothetical protein
MEDDERPENCDGDCDCQCDSHNNDEGYVTIRILGSVNHSPDLYVSTPSKTKWAFVEDMEEEVKSEWSRVS